MARLFGTDGVRGIANTELTPEMAFKLGKAGATVLTNLYEFLNQYKDSEKELFVIGGASVYKQTLDKADRLYITLINKDYDGDIYFPEVDLSHFNLIKEENIDLTIEKELSFLVYERK